MVSKRSHQLKFSDGERRGPPQLFPPVPKKPKTSDNPYTLNKVIQLSTRILDMKIQHKEYIKANL